MITITVTTTSTSTSTSTSTVMGPAMGMITVARALGARPPHGRAALARPRPRGRPRARVLSRRPADAVDLARRYRRDRAGPGGRGGAVRFGRAARRHAAQRRRRADRGTAGHRVRAGPAGRHPPFHLRLRPGRGPGRHRHRADHRRLRRVRRLRRPWTGCSTRAPSPTCRRSPRPRCRLRGQRVVARYRIGPAAGSARPRWSPTACTPGPTASPHWPCCSARAGWRSAGPGPTRWWAC